MTAEEAVKFQQDINKRSANTKQYEVEIGKLTAGNDQPDLIVSYRGKAAVLAIIGDKSENAVERLLADLTRRDDIFPKPAVKPRKKQAEDSGE